MADELRDLVVVDRIPSRSDGLVLIPSLFEHLALVDGGPVVLLAEAPDPFDWVQLWSSRNIENCRSKTFAKKF